MKMRRPEAVEDFFKGKELEIVEKGPGEIGPYDAETYLKAEISRDAVGSGCLVLAVAIAFFSASGFGRMHGQGAWLPAVIFSFAAAGSALALGRGFRRYSSTVVTVAHVGFACILAVLSGLAVEVWDAKAAGVMTLFSVPMILMSVRPALR